MLKRIKKKIRKIWNYFFPLREYEPPAFNNEIKKEKRVEVIFAEPVTSRDKFNTSKSLKEFLNKIDK